MLRSYEVPMSQPLLSVKNHGRRDPQFQRLKPCVIATPLVWVFRKDEHKLVEMTVYRLVSLAYHSP